MTFIDKELEAKIIAWRRDIHKNAELSFCENKTQALIESVLAENNISFCKVAKTGVLAKLNEGCGAQNGGVGVLRADMDALEIVETTGLEYACKNGVMHACGHDMHTAALLGALVGLKKANCKKEIWGLFQPGEELHPGGASIVLSEGVFDNVDVKWCLAQHCSPELECGVVGVRGGQFMASTDEIHINIIGKGGHGAMPHLGKDAVLAASAVVMAMQGINARENSAFTPSVISFGRIIGNGATNVMPDTVSLEGTFRTMNENWRENAKKRIGEVAKYTALAYGCNAEVEIKNGYPSVFNDQNIVDKFIPLTQNIAEVIQIERRMTAEDFGFLSQKYPSLIYRLGVGGIKGCGALHTSTFNPNEKALFYGAEILAQFADKY